MGEAARQGDVHQAGEAIKQMGEALSGSIKVEPVDFRTLKELLPESIAGMRRVSSEGSRTNVMGVASSKAEAVYEDGKGGRIAYEITDAGTLTGVAAMAFAWVNIEIDKEGDSGYERTTTVAGRKAYERYSKATRTGELDVIVGGRFIVGIKATRRGDEGSSGTRWRSWTSRSSRRSSPGARARAAGAPGAPRVEVGPRCPRLLRWSRRRAPPTSFARCRRSRPLRGWCAAGTISARRPSRAGSTARRSRPWAGRSSPSTTSPTSTCRPSPARSSSPLRFSPPASTPCRATAKPDASRGFVPSLTAWRENVGGLGIYVLVITVIFLVWARASLVTFALFSTGTMPDLKGFLAKAFSLGNIEFVIVYFAAGAMFATLVFAVSVVSVPMMLDRGNDAVSAAILSVQVLAKNPGTMAVWALAIVLLTGIGFATAFLGLVLTMPVIGHATWHAYRDCVAWGEPASPAPQP